mmetsp:Transcript_16894/g.53873  ORF Transcript_16894/g.53873 Transcript_16894/m.53873 type:complete len:292 (+) Transcript_16894:48-923(+)
MARKLFIASLVLFIDPVLRPFLPLVLVCRHGAGRRLLGVTAVDASRRRRGRERLAPRDDLGLLEAHHHQPDQRGAERAGARPDPPDPVVVPRVRDDGRPEGARRVDRAARHRDADHVCNEDGEANGQRRDGELVPEDGGLAVGAERLPVDRRLEDGVHEEKGAHKLKGDRVVEVDRRVLQPIRAEAARPVEVLSSRIAVRCAFEYRCAGDGAEHLRDEVGRAADGVALAGDRQPESDRRVDVPTRGVGSRVHQHGDGEPELERDDGDRCRVPVAVAKMRVRSSGPAAKEDE